MWWCFMQMLNIAFAHVTLLKGSSPKALNKFCCNMEIFNLGIQSHSEGFLIIWHWRPEIVVWVTSIWVKGGLGAINLITARWIAIYFIFIYTRRLSNIVLVSNLPCDSQLPSGSYRLEWPLTDPPPTSSCSIPLCLTFLSCPSTPSPECLRPFGISWLWLVRNAARDSSCVLCVSLFQRACLAVDSLHGGIRNHVDMSRCHSSWNFWEVTKMHYVTSFRNGIMWWDQQCKWIVLDRIVFKVVLMCNNVR